MVVGTSGLTETDFAEVDAVARKANRGVLACGNFALTVVLLQKFAEAAARLIPQWEIIDYAHAGKVDAPRGTARELAYRLYVLSERKKWTEEAGWYNGLVQSWTEAVRLAAAAPAQKPVQGQLFGEE